MRDSAIIYRSFFEAIKELPASNQIEVWNAIFEFTFNDNEVEINGISKTIFTLIKPQLLANHKRAEAGKKFGHLGAEHGKKGGRPLKNKPSNNPLITPSKPSNVNDNVNYNDNVNVNSNVNYNVNGNNKIQDFANQDLPVSDDSLKTKKRNTISHGAGENLIYKSCVDFWLNEFHQGWLFDGQQGKAIKSIIAKLTKKVTDAGKPHDDNSMIGAFKFFCQRLPEWYKDKDLAVINSKFNEIFDAIQKGKTLTKEERMQIQLEQVMAETNLKYQSK